MNEEPRDVLEEVEEEFEFLDTVEYEDSTYFLMIPATDSEEVDGEVFVMKLVEVDGEEMLEAVEEQALFDAVYQIFKEKNKDEFEFLD